MPNTAMNQTRTDAEPNERRGESGPPSPPLRKADSARPHSAPRGALFRALLAAGCDPEIAYTAEQQAHIMASESAAQRIQPVLITLQHMNERMADFATKADLANFATKADLADFATKADLANFATKADLANFATKADLADAQARMVKWMFGAMMAQTAVIVALVTLLS